MAIKKKQSAFNHVFPSFLSNLKKYLFIYLSIKVIIKIMLQLHMVAWIACKQGQEGQEVVKKTEKGRA